MNKARKSKMTMLDHALAYVRQRYPIFPTESVEDDLCTCGNPKCKSPGKHPLTSNGLHNATNAWPYVYRWWLKWPWANIALRTGEGLLVIDVDVGPGKEGDETLRLLEKAHGELPHTVESITGSGGRHIFLRYDRHKYTVKSGTNVLGQGIDIRAEGGYVIVPPSKHISGSLYDWNVDNDPSDGTPWAAAPKWVMGRCSRKKGSQQTFIGVGGARIPEYLMDYIRSALSVIPSDPRDTWLKIGMALHDETGGSEQGYEIWVEWSKQSMKFDPWDQMRTWKSFGRRGGITIDTLYKHAHESGWNPPPIDYGVDLSDFMVDGKCLEKCNGGGGEK